MPSRFFIIVLLWLAAGAFSPARGESLDDLPEVVTEYAKGERLMRQGDFLEAARLFTQLAGSFPDSKNVDLFVFNRGKAKMYFGELGDALATFESFITRFPHSPYLAYAHFFRGNILYQRGQAQRAFEAYTEAYRLGADARLTRLALNSMVEMLDHARTVELGPSDFGAMTEKQRCDLSSKLADALIGRQNYRVANNLMAVCGRSLEVPGVDVSDTLLGDLEIAMVLPFSGEYQPYGDEIYQGAVVAAEQFRQETGHQVTLAPYDSKGDPIDAARIVKELIHSASDAVIGPLTSEESATASATLACGTIPMITPAATQAGLTLLSESSFQLSPNIELQGVRAAEYAVINRGADSAAIITPTGNDQLRMARAFADRFRALGGTIVATEYYRPRDKDFGPHIRDIKAILLGGDPVDSTFYVNADGDTLDIEAVPVGIDCLYLPGLPDQLRLLLPQLNYFTVQAFYLGSDGWGDDAIYRLGDMVTKEAVFPSPFLEQRRGDVYYEFSNAYDARYGKKPSRLAGLGYDAARLVMKAAAGAGGRSGLVDNLRSVAGYQGASGTVTFGPNRENIELPLYQIVDGLPVYLGETGLPESGQAPQDGSGE